MDKVLNLMEGARGKLMCLNVAVFRKLLDSTSVETFDRVKRDITVKIDRRIGYSVIASNIHNFVRGSNE